MTELDPSLETRIFRVTGSPEDFARLSGILGLPGVLGDVVVNEIKKPHLNPNFYTEYNRPDEEIVPVVTKDNFESFRVTMLGEGKNYQAIRIWSVLRRNVGHIIRGTMSDIDQFADMWEITKNGKVVGIKALEFSSLLEYDPGKLTNIGPTAVEFLKKFNEALHAPQ